MNWNIMTDYHLIGKFMFRMHIFMIEIVDFERERLYFTKDISFMIMHNISSILENI